MALFKKKADPISERTRALNAEIAALESQIKRLGSQVRQNDAHPRLRSTAMPHGMTVSHTPEGPPPPPLRPVHEPIFENMDQGRLKSRDETATTPGHFNELGVRKYDLPALLRRLRDQFRGPSATNPRLVNYLAAGGIHGLRPMRYEKRVARRRFLALVAFLFFMLLGIIIALQHQ